MEPDGTEVTTSGDQHQLVHMCRQHEHEHDKILLLLLYYYI